MWWYTLFHDYMNFTLKDGCSAKNETFRNKLLFNYSDLCIWTLFLRRYCCILSVSVYIYMERPKNISLLLKIFIANMMKYPKSVSVWKIVQNYDDKCTNQCSDIQHTEACDRSIVSKIRDIGLDIWMISPLIKHSFLLSSSTVFMFSIHRASMGPSNTTHFLSGVSVEANSRNVLATIPSVHWVKEKKCVLN